MLEVGLMSPLAALLDVHMTDWKSVRLKECRIGRVQHWKSVEDWKSVGLEECKIGRV